MNIAIIGYGSMGQAVARVAKNRGHEIVSIIDRNHPDATHNELNTQSIAQADVLIDFSSHEIVLDNIKIASSAGVNMVEGVTGWYDEINQVRELVEQTDIGFLWSGNFSIGVNLYLKIVQKAAELFNAYSEYDVWGNELHHNGKVDSPSGTTKLLEDILLTQLDRKTKVVEDKLERRIEPEEIHFSSTRGGVVNFEHTVCFGSVADTITLKHSARNRDGYALGAVLVAEWIEGKKGFFGMEDFLDTNLN
jgi:4-hydroxy-tetrahydrodipicolinate reductase